MAKTWSNKDIRDFPIVNDRVKMIIRDAETKRTVTITAKLANFNDTDEMYKWLDDVRSGYIRRNLEYRNDQKMLKEQYLNKKREYRKAADDIVKQEFPRMPGKRILGKEEQLEKLKMMSPLANVIHKDHLDLHLDAGTGNSGLLLGSSKSGKSRALLAIWERYFKGPMSIADDNEPYICTLFAENSQIGLYDKGKSLLRCGAWNKNTEKYIRLEKLINSKTKNHYKFCTLIDDFSGLRYSQMLKNMILSYRNSNISTFICLHGATLMDKHARASVNNVLIFRLNTNESALQTINTFLRSYFHKMGLKNDAEMLDFFYAVTNNHGFICIHNASGSISFHRLAL